MGFWDCSAYHGTISFMSKLKSSAKLASARLAKEQARAKLRILQSAALEGSLLPIDRVRSQWAYAFASLRERRPLRWRIGSPTAAPAAKPPN
jgi:hypothetical protein